MHGAITDVPGIRVGHWTNRDAATGCTVVLCEDGAVAGVDVRGSAPGTRETDLLRPMNLVTKVHTIVLSGGSAFGLDAAGGVMRYLEERGTGYETSGGRVPIVPAAILFDLAIGDTSVRPGMTEGYQACLSAGDREVAEGCVGAGTGATVGKALGIGQATKGGLGTASTKGTGGIVVAALVVVNAFGDVIEPGAGRVLAGPRRADGSGFASTTELLAHGDGWQVGFPSSTTIGVIATNARLDKEQINKVAQMAQDGIARSINPCHTMYDGDALFALSLGRETADVNVVGVLAAVVVSDAIVRAVKLADSLVGIPAISDIA
ncbi:MAG: P1 family peptidase [Dehalococcoidales bacterium]|nr:P1 family peptidase [Dehalococcoidales bacterium]